MLFLNQPAFAVAQDLIPLQPVSYNRFVKFRSFSKHWAFLTASPLQSHLDLSIRWFKVPDLLCFSVIKPLIFLSSRNYLAVVNSTGKSKPIISDRKHISFRNCANYAYPVFYSPTFRSGAFACPWTCGVCAVGEARSMSLSTDKDMPGTRQALTATSETPMAYTPC